MPEIKKITLEEYKVRGSIHTVELSCDFIDESKIEVQDLVSKKVIQGIHKSTKYDRFKVRVNVHKFYNRDILSYSEFLKTLNTITNIMEVQDWYFLRVDFRLDNLDPESYEKYFKLHKAFIIAVSRFERIPIDNLYEDIGSTTRRHSVCAKGAEVELEYYDRAKKSRYTGNKTDPAVARFEIRSTIGDLSRIRKKLGSNPSEDQVVYDLFKYRWVERLTFDPEDLERVYAWQNEELLEKYKTLKERRQEGEKTKTLRFIETEQTFIFTRKQLSDLMEKIGYTGKYSRESAAQSRADQCDRVIGIEYISKKSMDYATNVIKSAIYQYFDN